MEATLLLRWREHPREFFELCWPGTFVWPKLEEILDSIIHNKRTVIRSGHGVGKSWLMARIVIWFLTVYKPSKVITTAPIWPQVEKILWGEIRTAYANSRVPLGGRLLSTEWKISDDCFAVGISTTKNVQDKEFGSASMQGYHSPNMLFVLDEAAGIPPAIWIAATSLLTGDNNKMVAIGNPASSHGPFYDCFMSEIWNKVHVSCFDHPNVTEGRIIVPGAVTREWIAERKEEWGEESPLYKAKVLGIFPDEGDDTLFPMSAVEACMVPRLVAEGRISYGLDVARYGEDETFSFKAHGSVFSVAFHSEKAATTDTVGRMITEFKKSPASCLVAVDDSGVGGGVTDQLKEAGIPTIGVNFGESASDTEKFFNSKAELFWNLHLAVKAGEIQLPDDPKLLAQLTSIRFSFSGKGQIRIEGKDEMKKRGLKSPDRADALAIAYFASRQGSVKLDKTRRPGITTGLRSKQF